MSVLSVFPTLNCVYIGHPDRPLNIPRQLAFSVRSYLAQVVALTEPSEVSWCVDAVAEQARTIDAPVSRPPVMLACSGNPGDVNWPEYWADPTRMRRRLRRELAGVMHGYTLHMVGFAVAGHLGILATDSPELVRSVAAVATVGDQPLARISAREPWRPIVHCRKGIREDDSCLVRFRDSGETWAWGSGHDGRALLSLDNGLAASAAASTH